MRSTNPLSAVTAALAVAGCACPSPASPSCGRTLAVCRSNRDCCGGFVCRAGLCEPLGPATGSSGGNTGGTSGGSTGGGGTGGAGSTSGGSTGGTTGLVGPGWVDAGLLPQCAGTANVLYVDGNDYIYTGQLTVTEGQWTSQVWPAASPGQVDITVTPADPNAGAQWTLDFGGPNAASLAAQDYPDAGNSPGQPVPQLDIQGDHHGCDYEAGGFDVFDVEADGDGGVTFAANFQLDSCDGTGGLSGCIVYSTRNPEYVCGPGGGPAPGAPDPGPVGPCLAGGNLLYLQGATSLGSYPDGGVLEQAGWLPESATGPSWIGLDDSGASGLTVWLQAAPGLGAPLVAGSYPATAGGPCASSAYVGASPPLDCDSSAGDFSIDSIAWDGGTLTSLVATFAVTACNGQPSTVQGCLAYAAP